MVLWVSGGIILALLALVPLGLFAIDLTIIKYASAPGVNVLLVDPKQAEIEQQKTAEW